MAGVAAMDAPGGGWKPFVIDEAEDEDDGVKTVSLHLEAAS